MPSVDRQAIFCYPETQAEPTISKWHAEDMM
jgi:hypothetical protein